MSGVPSTRRVVLRLCLTHDESNVVQERPYVLSPRAGA